MQKISQEGSIAHQNHQQSYADKNNKIYEIIQEKQAIVVQPLNKTSHKHTFIWLHGLNQNQKTHLNDLLEALSDHLSYLKIILPRAPTRYVTLLSKETTSWFDIKFRGKKSFQVDFDEAFSSAQVKDSYQRILKPIIEKQSPILRDIQVKNNTNQKNKLIIGGFSQGCGMSLHSMYENQNKINAMIGVSGYLFPISKFNKELKTFKRIIYGLADNLRPWQFTKMTYQGKIPQEEIVLIEGMKHQINENTKKQLKRFMNDLFCNNQLKQNNSLIHKL